jgi:PKD repeat protein
VQFQLDGVNLEAKIQQPHIPPAGIPPTATNGTHNLTAFARDAAGNQTTSAVVSVTVNNLPPAPVAAFSAAPTSGTAPLQVQFTDQSTGNITSRLWAFGNGATSTATNPAYTYTTTGSYTVTLTATGPGGSRSAEA